MHKVLGPDFFNKPTLTVARELLGKFLVRRVGGNPSTGLRARTVALMITETEAYDGFKDMASHARRGKTPRNTPMYARAGTIYVYFTYGMHWMLNIVCGRPEYPAAVLIRGLEAPRGSTSWKNEVFQPTTGIKKAETTKIHMEKHCPPVTLNGPAKLTKFLGIDKNLNAKMLGTQSGLWVEDRGVVVRPRDIERTPRIGIGYAGEVWAKKPWRFVLRDR